MLASLLGSSSATLSRPHRPQEPHYLSPQSSYQDATVTASPASTFSNYAVTNLSALPHFSQPTPHPGHPLPASPSPRTQHSSKGTPGKPASRLPLNMLPPSSLPSTFDLPRQMDADTTSKLANLSVCLPVCPLEGNGIKARRSGGSQGQFPPPIPVPLVRLEQLTRRKKKLK